MRRNVHAVIPEEDFVVTAGEDALSVYTFNTGVAKHMFCKRCGITPFYRPRSNPHHYAGMMGLCVSDQQFVLRLAEIPSHIIFFAIVTVACISSKTIQSITTKRIDGRNWEQAVVASGIQDL